MTNGEKIQTILDIDKDCTEVYGKNGMMTFSVPQDWWNAEYEEPVIPDNGVKNELNRVKDELAVTSGLEKNSKKLEKDFGELDCISRADAIRVASGYCHPSNVAKELAKLPSVTPQEPRKGHWLMPNKEYSSKIWRKCSCCGTHIEKYSKHISFDGGVHYIPYRLNYCYVCGADMREVEE